MSKKIKRKAHGVRDKPKSGNNVMMCSMDSFDSLICSGYTRLSDNPEIVTAVNKIADLVSAMTIHLMQNTEDGDTRVKNSLAKKIDVYPNKLMTRKTFISSIVRSLLLEGDGNAYAYVQTKDGFIDQIYPLPPQIVTTQSFGMFQYSIRINGVTYDPENLLHFVINPNTNYPWMGTGYRVMLKQIAHNLKQARETEKGFMESKWKPSVIVKVDTSSDELSSPDGRKKFASQYLDQEKAGQPWMIPSEFMDVEVVKPLSLQDLAIVDTMKLDKQTVASILDVPAFVLGVGSFDKFEWNNWINTRIHSIAQVIEQEMTRKLLISPDLYFKLNPRSLYAYDMKELADVGASLYVKGIMEGNEVRDWIGCSPLPGLNKLVILENFIPSDKVGDQKKLIQKEGDDNG